jgi:hypothetical protein
LFFFFVFVFFFGNGVEHVMGLLLQYSYIVGNDLKHSVEVFCINCTCFLGSDLLNSLFYNSSLSDTRYADQPKLYCLALQKPRPAFSYSVFKTGGSQP